MKFTMMESKSPLDIRLVRVYTGVKADPIYEGNMTIKEAMNRVIHNIRIDTHDNSLTITMYATNEIINIYLE